MWTVQQIDGVWYLVSTYACSFEPTLVTSGWRITWADGPLDLIPANQHASRLGSAYQFYAAGRTISVNTEEKNSYFREDPIAPPKRAKTVRWHNGAWQKYTQATGWVWA